MKVIYVSPNFLEKNSYAPIVHRIWHLLLSKLITVKDSRCKKLIINWLPWID